MATESPAPPPNPTDENPPNSGAALELQQPAIGDMQDVKEPATKQSFTPSVFFNSEPMREEQVENAVKFLSHPKVRGSPVIYRRSFLEKKGLTKEEIDEAFRRAPDSSPNAPNVQATSTNQERQLNLASNVRQQAPTSSMIAAPATGVSKSGTLSQYRFHWSHAFFAVGFLAASGAGTALLIKNTIVPRLKLWIRKVVLEEEDANGEKAIMKPSLAEEATTAAKAAAAAAVDAAKATQEMVNSKNAERRYFEEFTNLLGAQVQEMKSMNNAIRKLEGQSSTSERIPLSEQDYYRGSVLRTKQTNVNGNGNVDLRSVRSSSPPASVDTSMPTHPKSYMEIMSMVQRGEKPSNIRDINDMPPNPNQPPSNPRLEPRSKPWEVSQTQYTSSQSNGSTAPINGDSPVSWWQQKNPRITEIENEPHSTYNYSVSSERPIKKTWVPPQPPPVAMAEAAAAIRHTKPSFRKEQTVGDQLSSASSDGIDELQRIQKISESGGLVEVNEGSSEMSSSEIQEEI